MFELGDYDRAATVLQPPYDRYVERGDERGVAAASVPLGVMAAPQHPGAGEDMLCQAVEPFRRLDDRWGLALALLAFGSLLVHRHRGADAVAPLEDGEHIACEGDEDILLSIGRPSPALWTRTPLSRPAMPRCDSVRRGGRLPIGRSRCTWRTSLDPERASASGEPA
jgi:hypothetical protein